MRESTYLPMVSGEQITLLRAKALEEATEKAAQTAKGQGPEA